jgi:C-terminal processing protease CtpA/Prc
VSVLVGERTFSSSEGLAYHLQSRRRARIVGQRTPGAADHITPVDVSGHVRALLPEARCRHRRQLGGTGVVPDLPCEPAGTLTVATEALHDG